MSKTMPTDKDVKPSVEEVVKELNHLSESLLFSHQRQVAVQAADLLSSLEARALTAEARLAEAVALLDELAEVDGEGVEDYGDDHKAVLTIGRSTDYWLTLGHFRRARAIAEQQGG